MKASLLTPMYLSFSWVLTVSYQLFTDTAVKSIATFIDLSWPAAGAWLNSNVETIIFIYAFTWIFVLSSVIPSVILGKERSILIQYAVVLALTLIAFFMADILQVVAGIQVTQIFEAANLFKNPIIAGAYLAVPYLFMIGFDIRSRKAQKGRKQLEKIVKEVSKKLVLEGSLTGEEDKTSKEEGPSEAK
jgi:hypothetical protein